MREPLTPAGELRPEALAAELALLGSDLHGFDNGDRAHLRKIARALVDPSPNAVPVALALAMEAVQHRASVALARTRPEATLLVAVLWLLTRAAEHPAPPG